MDCKEKKEREGVKTVEGKADAAAAAAAVHEGIVD